MGILNCVVVCFWIWKDEGSFRWNMEWVVGKREGRSVGELAWGNRAEATSTITLDDLCT